jgi:hypothetical protein
MYINVKGYPVLITDDLLFVDARYPQPHYTLVDLADSSEIDVAVGESLDTVITNLENAERVYATSGTTRRNYIIGLTHNYKADSSNIAFYWDSDIQIVLDKLSESGIAYQELSLPYIQGLAPMYYPYSLGEQRFWAATDGIHLSQTNQLIVASEQSATAVTSVWPQGWVNDNHAVVYGDGNRLPLIGGSFLFPTLIDVPQPILLLEVPPQYWAENEATATPCRSR